MMTTKPKWFARAERRSYNLRPVAQGELSGYLLSDVGSAAGSKSHATHAGTLAGDWL